MSNFAQSIQITKDNSPTIYSEQFQQTYHSIHGAIAESEHVFIQHGLVDVSKNKSEISIFEMGLGTGLNAALTWKYAEKNNLKISYEAIELFPVDSNIIADYKTTDEVLNQKIKSIYNSDWDQEFETENFKFTKLKIDLDHYQTSKKYDLIYFDAFGPKAQPELWTEKIFKKLFNLLNPNGILTTYCAQGQAKRNLKAAGFTISNPPGPIGKREMTVALKVASQES
jgi:tRNA U34 5-methylaminomethyl-2-thiouridine-forming methyltransferase MnmC